MEAGRGDVSLLTERMALSEVSSLWPQYLLSDLLKGPQIPWLQNTGEEITFSRKRKLTAPNMMPWEMPLGEIWKENTSSL